MDRISARKRSWNMARIRGKDTRPELAVRRILYTLGYRYRIHVRTLPGTPDIVFRKRRVAIFVNGCFWHQHRCRVGRRKPGSRRAYWLRKLSGNKKRDLACRRQLRRAGWTVLTLWECEIRKRDSDLLAARLVAFLDPGSSGT
jgi:DNA mismatch endonuclease (patch repair protein)